MEKIIMWKPELETMSRDRLLEYQLDLLRKQMAYIYERAPFYTFYKRKFDDAGIRPEHIKHLNEVRKVSFTTKEEKLLGSFLENFMLSVG